MTDEAAPKPRRKRAASAPETPPEATEAAQEQVDGVAVIKQVAEDGSIRTAIQLLGTVQVTEVQTLLELGLKDFREAVGLQAAR